jgi:hypothetical protein
MYDIKQIIEAQDLMHHPSVIAFLFVLSVLYNEGFVPSVCSSTSVVSECLALLQAGLNNFSGN